MDVAEVEALVHELASALRGRGWLLATAESCTGGLVAARSAAERTSAPHAIAQATGSLTAPCSSINAASTPSSSVLARLL